MAQKLFIILLELSFIVKAGIEPIHVGLGRLNFKENQRA
jgi:hypothetical protein